MQKDQRQHVVGLRVALNEGRERCEMIVVLRNVMRYRVCFTSIGIESRHNLQRFQVRHSMIRDLLPEHMCR